MAHRILPAILALVVFGVVASLGIRGCAYYLAPLQERPFRSDYSAMKPSGEFGHGLGVVGACMVATGVAVYSVRKRLRSRWHLGRLSLWLEIHIFLCLLGPVLVIFHTTFKAGGVAAITLWTMVSVAASGLIGRFLYAQIPRNMKGVELSTTQIREELDTLGGALALSPLGRQVIHSIDEIFSAVRPPTSVAQTVSSFIRLRGIRRRSKKMIRFMIERSSVSQEAGRELHRAASAHAALLQKSILLAQAGRLFYYWHSVHLPFTIIMFVTLAIHIVVEVLLGYKWIF